MLNVLMQIDVQSQQLWVVWGSLAVVTLLHNVHFLNTCLWLTMWSIHMIHPMCVVLLCPKCLVDMPNMSFPHVVAAVPYPEVGHFRKNPEILGVAHAFLDIGGAV